jgi:hypothetical protein
MAPLPQADQAILPPEKFLDYILNPDHERGRHKARVFRSALGIARKDWEYLRDQIVARLPSAPFTSVSPTPFGFRYEVPMLMEGLNGKTHEVITAWIVRNEGDPPQLISAYVNIP